MAVSRVKTLAELTKYLQPLAEVFDQVETRFAVESDKIGFISKVIENFRPENHYFGDLYEVTGEIKFFSVILPEEKPKIFWWLLYSHPRFRTQTKEEVRKIFECFAKQGYSVCFSKTTRVTPSYKRWMKSLGGYPYEVTYKTKFGHEQK